MTVGQRIRLTREKLGLTQENVAKIVGVAIQTIYKYEHEIVTNIPLDKLEKIASALQTTPAYLMGWKEIEKQNDEIVDEVVKMLDDPNYLKRKKGVRIPVFGNVAAGVPILAIENYDRDDPDDWEEISEKMANTGDFIALRIHGDSMEPRMQEGDVVIVRLQPNIETGDIAIVRINGDEATCKKIKKTPEGLTLISTNPTYDPMFFTPKEVQTLPVEIIGKVVELRAKYD